jgi:hypothetical protein
MLQHSAHAVEPVCQFLFVTVNNQGNGVLMQHDNGWGRWGRVFESETLKGLREFILPQLPGTSPSSSPRVCTCCRPDSQVDGMFVAKVKEILSEVEQVSVAMLLTAPKCPLMKIIRRQAAHGSAHPCQMFRQHWMSVLDHLHLMPTQEVRSRADISPCMPTIPNACRQFPLHADISPCMPTIPIACRQIPLHAVNSQCMPTIPNAERATWAEL